MPDNTTLNTGTGGDVIATDELSTLNGGAVSGVKVQRVKVGFGSDGTFRDVDATNPLPVTDPTPLFIGRASTFRTPGRAGTTGQNIMAIHNATGSSVTVTVKKIVVDMYQTVVKAVTVAPPIIRIWKVTVLPTNGTSLTKTKIGGSTTSSASVTVFGDASADGTGSATTLTTTRPAGTFVAQKFASRFITAAGYEPADTIEFLDKTTVQLAALEGLVVFLDYTAATQNPTTDMWTAVIEWEEKTT